MRIRLLLFFVSMAHIGSAQQATQLSSAEIYEEIKKLNFFGSAMYVAAHPDDENTRLISYLSKGLHARTSYCSLTRGDGGQNLIGTEIRELLGVIRSQELQMARSVDGGQQFFTRANDFGYSKHPDETLRIWDKDKVLADLVYAIRYFRPDVIVNRFDHRTPGKTHGHHTSSAMLAVEAFEMAADPNAYPEQLEQVDTWQARRHFMNTSWWFYGSREKFAEADKTNFISVDAGGYFPTLGKSNNEFSALARSKHRSQGFGSAGSRGTYTEYLELIGGDLPEDKDNLFGGVETSWKRLEGGARILPLATAIETDFDFADPSSSIQSLLSLHDNLSNLKDSPLKKIKLKQITDLIIQCSGLWAEASIENQQVGIGDSLEVQVELTSRSDFEITVAEVSINSIPTTTISGALEPFTENKWYETFVVDKNSQFSNPYWLDETGALGVYKVDKMEDRILPQTPPAITVDFKINIEGSDIAFTREVIHKYVDPAVGEIRQPVAIVPAATMKFDKDLYLFADSAPQKIKVAVTAGKDNLKGDLLLRAPEGWSIMPATISVDIKDKGFEETYEFQLSSPNNVNQGKVKASLKSGSSVHNKSLTNISYDHIPLQTILSPAEAKVVKVPLNKGGSNIGYVMGAGDKMPESLENVGYQVDLLPVSDLNTMDLTQYDAIVIGIRAYNKIKNLKLYNDYLFGYAEQGGTLITQYNTSRRINFEDLSPYNIKLSRKRVTDELAEMRILDKNHKVFNHPNKINKSDFGGWVQERGLYFAEEWGEEFTPLLSSNDEGEEPLEGSLLVADHGEGHIVYTSISWFRQLPAGVPGAFRLFANLLALSDDPK